MIKKRKIGGGEYPELKLLKGFTELQELIDGNDSVIPGTDPESINIDLNQKAGFFGRTSLRMTFRNVIARLGRSNPVDKKEGHEDVGSSLLPKMGEGVAERRMRVKTNAPLTRISGFRKAQAEIQPSTLGFASEYSITPFASSRVLLASHLGRGKRVAFTLAEVIITLGIIGVVAAMTLPTVINKVQEHILKSQFKKTYNLINVAVQKTVADLGFIPECYGWDVNPYRPVTCLEFKPDGACKKIGYEDGSPVPDNYNSGPKVDCELFNSAIKKNLKIIKECKNMEKDGCTVHYKGIDTVYKENGKSDSEAAYAASRDNMGESTFNNLDAIILTDGTTLIAFQGGHPYIDINGKKGPNKWGYDLFRFARKGNQKSGIFYAGYGNLTEKGGKTSIIMIQNMYK